MLFKQILEALSRLEAGQARALSELEALRRQVDGLEDGTMDVKLQQGIDNLMAFDGRPGKREGA